MIITSDFGVSERTDKAEVHATWASNEVVKGELPFTGNYLTRS